MSMATGGVVLARRLAEFVRINWGLFRPFAPAAVVPVEVEAVGGIQDPNSQPSSFVQTGIFFRLKHLKARPSRGEQRWRLHVKMIFLIVSA